MTVRMCKWLLVPLVCGGWPVLAGAIRGVVVEDASGVPLARSLVVVQPIAGTDAATQSVRSNHNGQFEFASLPPGAYLVLASRRGFAPVQYGQKQWNGSGVPVVVDKSDAPSLEIRLRRYGAIGGTVLDENDVGLPDHDVVAYRKGRPPVLVARTTTDDRGMYRFLGLEPGSYLVRTVGKDYDEGRYLPTFSRQARFVQEAYTIDVRLDRETDHVDIRPFSGRLFAISGRVGPTPPGPVSVALISDTGTVTVSCDPRGHFAFPPSAPGTYELYAVGRRGAGYQAITLDRNLDYSLNFGPPPQLRVRIEDPQGQPIDPQAVQILLRRKDLSGTGAPQTLHSPAALAPGRWELALAPTPNYYAARVSSGRGRPDGWNEVELAAGVDAEFGFVLSPHPGTLHGVVENAGNPVAGVPVYLEADGLEPRMTRTDTHGKYEFYGLAPGRYRLLASFDAQTADAAHAVEVREGQDQAIDLRLYAAP